MSDYESTNDDPVRNPRGSGLGETLARRETMADGRRYIIYYTFQEQKDNAMIAGTEETAQDV